MNKYFITLSILAILLLAACEKDANLSDSPLNPGSELGVEQVDTFKLTSYTIEQDPISGELSSKNALLGIIDDSRIGLSQAAFYTQLGLSVNAYDLGENPVLDSVVLALTIDDAFGPFSSTLDFNVYEVTDEMDADEGYDSDTELSTNATAIGSLSGYTYDDQTTLRIPMTTTFGQTLLDQFDTEAMESSDNFLDYFYGIYVAADANTGGDGMLKLDLLDENTQLELYFHSDDDADSTYAYTITSSRVSISQYTNDLSGSEVDALLNDNTDNDDLLYIAPMSTTKGVVVLPDLSAYENTIINKAEISFYQADYTSTIAEDFPEADRIFLYNNIGDSSLVFLEDFDLTDATAFGGDGNLTSINGQNTLEFKFDITKYIQQYVQDNIETEGLYVTVLSQNEANRVKLGGGTHADFPIKLNIVYTTAE